MKATRGEMTDEERRLNAAFAPPAFDEQRGNRILEAARRAATGKPRTAMRAGGLAKVLAVAATLAVVAVVAVIGGRMLFASGETAPIVSVSPFANPSLPIVSLSDGLSQMQRPVSLPDVRVAGTPDAVVVNHGPHKANSLWLHYPTGIFLQIHPNDEAYSAWVSVARASGMTHPDGSQYVRLVRVAGRDTAVMTQGWLVQHGRKLGMSAENAVSWGQNGYVYVLEPLSPPGPASLATMLKVAASVPNAPPASAWISVEVVGGAVAVLVLGGLAVLATRRRARSRRASLTSEAHLDVPS